MAGIDKRVEFDRVGAVFGILVVKREDACGGVRHCEIMRLVARRVAFHTRDHYTKGIYYDETA